MRNRLSKMGKNASWMLILLAASGLSSSCKDEYTLDDEKPSWLNSSIYESLESKGKFQTYLRLLADPDVNPTNARPLTEVLARTGSKTVFVADDDAWKEFFTKNAQLPETDPWHTATSYENLSASQKKLLIHTSMLNNAIVMENLASSESSGSNVPVRGEYLRRYTDVEVTDSVTHLDGNSLPANYNVGNKETDYWSRFRTENGGNGLYMVNDSSQSMMVHFTNEHMKKAGVTDGDFAIFMGKERQTQDVHIYDALLKDKDGVCENGYVNVTEKVLAPLPNMAEVIRTNGETKIFSHMLDRWSAPFYNKGVTEAYKTLMASKGIDWKDSIFSKRYFSDLSWRHQPLKLDPNFQKFRDAASEDVALKFDPGWNGYYDEYRGPEFDMAAMYIPNDETMWEYFQQGGGGWQLIQTYYLKAGTADEIAYEAPKNYEELYHQIDQIPISTLRSLINIIMFKSFVSSVPSKMTKLRDDAQEQIFYAEDVNHIVKTKLANNGVVYIMDKVYGPADYTSVAAPAYISNTNLVMRWAIYNGSTTATDYMGLNYYAYLKAMQSKFAFFLPSDNGMKYYYDPVSFKSQKSRMVGFSYKSGALPIAYSMYDYNANTATLGKSYSLEKMANGEITNRLKDILESHTIVLDGISEINSGEDEYYLAKNGSPMKVEREGGKIVRVMGGFQLENEANGLEGSISADNKNEYTEIKGIRNANVEDMQEMSNGTTYILDAPMLPSSRSVYNIMTNDGKEDSDEYGAFYELCQENEEIIRACGLVDEKKLTVSQQKSELKKYQVFVDDKGPDYNVQFFSNYNYTIFVPTATAVNEAIANGLPTWNDINNDYETNMQAHLTQKETLQEKMKAVDYVEDAADVQELQNIDSKLSEDSLRLQAKITYLTNFVRYHFADISVFADKSKFAPTEYVSSSYDNIKGLFVKLNMQRQNPGELQVQDANGGQWLKTTGKVNVMARDVSCSKSPFNASTMNGITIDGSSFAVIHQITGVLNHTSLVNGKYEGIWDTPSQAKSYLKRFAIH